MTKTGATIYGERLNWFFNESEYFKPFYKIGESFYHVLTSVTEQVRALPELAKTLYLKKEPRELVKHTGRILCQDILPIIVANTLNTQLQQWANPESDTARSGMASWFLSAGLYLVTGLVWLFTKRKQLKVSTRSSVLLTKFSIFDEATQDTREKVSQQFNVCKAEECSRLRYAKGRFRNLLVWYSQKLAVALIRQLFPGGETIAKFLTYILDGQLFVGYRLDNDGLCDRHIGAYFQEYVELCLGVGLSFNTLVELVTYQIEQLTGLPQSYYQGAIKNFMSIYFVGLAHHMNMPEPVKESERSILRDPLAMIRSGVGESIDLLTPGVKKKVTELFVKKSKPFPFREWIDWSVKIYQDEKTQKIMVWFVPRMFLSAQNFVNDEVISSYWPDMRAGAVESLDMLIEASDNLKTIDGWLPSAVTRLAVSYAAGLPKKAAGAVIELLKSEEVSDFLRELRSGVNHLKADSEQVAWQGTPQELQKTLEKIKQKQALREKERFDAKSLVQQVRQGLDNYLRYTQTSKSHAGTEGLARIRFYQQLINAFPDNFNAELQVCFIILSNDKGGTLQRKLDEALLENRQVYLPKIKRHLLVASGKSEEVSARISYLKELSTLAKYVNRIANKTPTFIQSSVTSVKPKILNLVTQAALESNSSMTLI